MSRELYIEQTDFSEEPPAPGWTRLRPGGEVRLRNAYFIRCDEVVKDPRSGAVVELRCTYDPESLGKTPGAERKNRAPPSSGCRRSTPCRPRCASMTGC